MHLGLSGRTLTNKIRIRHFKRILIALGLVMKETDVPAHTGQLEVERDRAGNMYRTEKHARIRTRGTHVLFHGLFLCSRVLESWGV